MNKRAIRRPRKSDFIRVKMQINDNAIAFTSNGGNIEMIIV